MKRRARRLLTDWTTSAGVDGAGLLALVVGDAVLPEALHLRTLGYEVFAVTDAPDPEVPRLHVLDLGPADLPEQWHGRFALVVSIERKDTAALDSLSRCLGPGGVLVVIAEPPVTAVPDEVGLQEVVVEAGADPDHPGTERFRGVWVRLA